MQPGALKLLGATKCAVQTRLLPAVTGTDIGH